MLGKQWLNRYASIEMRGSAIERSQNRQRKLDGIVTWYFHYVMESLPLMLQFALLLLGGALSLYLWGINTTVASVVVGIASFGVAFYALIVVAGTASVSCPYQTPGAQVLRHIFTMFNSALSSLADGSVCVSSLVSCYDSVWERGVPVYILPFVPVWFLLSPFVLVYDIYRFVRKMIVGVLTLARRTYKRFRWPRSPQVDGLIQQVAALDLRCISWILQTSLDKDVRLSTLKSLAAMTTLADFDPALVSACFDVLLGCIVTADYKAAITQGSEELATVSATCCLRTFAHLTTMDPTSSILKDMRKRYTAAITPASDFENFPAYRSFAALHNVFYRSERDWLSTGRLEQAIRWNDYEITDNEHVTYVQLAQFKYQMGESAKVPRWILRFVLHHLSQDPPPPASVVIGCLSIIAIDMGCTISDQTAPDEPDEEYVHI